MGLRKFIKRKLDLIELFSLYKKQPWLKDRETGMADLFKMCADKDQKELIVDLLGEFKFLTGEQLSGFLNAIAEYIINVSGFQEESTQVAAITYDDEADSSQRILDHIKMPLFRKGWTSLKTVNRFGAIVKNANAGLVQIILIDEFIGSGQTIRSKIKQLKNDIKVDFNLKICFIAGMDHAIKALEGDGYEVFCPLRLQKGISERYHGIALENATKSMLSIETNLSPKINQYELSTYSFGYNYAEAIYSLEGCHGNTPNSVFPVFWWPRHLNGRERVTLLTRFEKGLK